MPEGKSSDFPSGGRATTVRANKMVQSIAVIVFSALMLTLFLIQNGKLIKIYRRIRKLRVQGYSSAVKQYPDLRSWDGSLSRIAFNEGVNYAIDKILGDDKK